MKVDVAIIGAGVSGTAIANTLAKYKLSVLVIEKSNDISNGATKANSGIVHAGYDAHPGTNMAVYNMAGNLLYHELCQRLEVPYRQIGSLVLAFDDADMKTLRELKVRGEKNAVPGLQILNAEAVKESEPFVNPDIRGALYAPTAGIVSPYELAIALMENAMDNGTKLMLESAVAHIENQNEGYVIDVGKSEAIEARAVINCAGVYADEIHNMVLPPAFRIKPKRGEYYLLDKYAAGHINHVIFQCPSAAGKGVLVSPTVHGNVIVGPNSQHITGKESTETTAEGLKEVWETALRSIPELPRDQIITTFSGIRVEPDTGDFVIREYPQAPGFIDVAGIKSPGLTAAPAFALQVEKYIIKYFGMIDIKSDYQPRRRKLIHFQDLPHEERRELVEKDSRYGRIICRCETVTEGEIVDLIHRNAGARTLDGVKRRARCGGGRCQGGFCGPRIIEILARELGIPRVRIRKDGAGSEIIIEDRGAAK